MASLLDLPDELLVLIIDQALGAFLPARYKSRQQTACALSLVSRRLGGLARPKVLEVVQMSSCTDSPRDAPALLPQDTSRIRAVSIIDEADYARVPLERCILPFWRSFAQITSLHIRVRCELSVSIARTFPSLLSLWLSNVLIADVELIASPTLKQLRLGQLCFSIGRSLEVAIDERTFPSLRSLALAADVIPPDSCTLRYAATLDEIVLLVGPYGGSAGSSSPWDCPPLLVDMTLSLVTPGLFRVDNLEPYRHVRLSISYSDAIDFDKTCSANLSEIANCLAAGELPNLALLYIPSFDDFPPDAFTTELAALHRACDARGVEVVVDPECCDSEHGEVFSAHFRAYRRRMRAAAEERERAHKVGEL